MTEVDELDVNPIFRALQKQHQDLYDKAQENCYIVCIPQTSSLVNISVTKELIATHILKPSPYFKSQYQTLHSPHKVVQLEENGKEFRTVEGFSEEHIVKILNEELGYNQDFKPYKILILECPFNPSLKGKAAVSNTTDASNGFSAFQTYAESISFLKSFAEYTMVLRQVEENLKQFNANYMILKDYFSEVEDKLKSLCQQVSQDCLRCSKFAREQDPKFREALDFSVENYIMGAVHKKVFSVIKEAFEEDDKLLFTKCKQLHNVTAQQLGVNKKIACPLPQAVVELANLDRLQTPLEKLYCLKSTIDNASQTIQKHLEENRAPSVSTAAEEGYCLTSDDLIPILVTVIAQAQCRYFASNLQYIESFHWASEANDRGNLSYCLVTFKAAVEYMKTTSFDDMERQPSLKREISLEELRRATSGPISGEFNSSITGSTTSQSAGSHYDRQLERISQMLKASNDELRNTEKSKTPHHRSIFGESYERLQNPHKETSEKKKDKEDLGDFLTSLQNDMFGMNFGKQS
uniref:Ankyrin repeat domain-containing protein 27-like isoform X2 n=1 Tax=Crassostrea virginica TaxID=6565 RepID=A0A8B8EIT6_CRAVI|nr:ankyrin repeat domain-containing protein 27-like isoform X2 [Crassostrea virginica]